MKELTSVLTLQLTFICDFEDDDAEEMLASKEKRAEMFTKMLKEDIAGLDDIQILANQVFVLDKED